jgi:hypothetical protein
MLLPHPALESLGDGEAFAGAGETWPRQSEHETAETRPKAKALQIRIGKHEGQLSEYKLYMAARTASKEYLSETKRKFLPRIRDLACPIEHPWPQTR